MTLQGTYDPGTYVAADQSTWPQPTSGVLYQPGMWWQISAAGVWPPTGDQLAVRDRLYVYATPRTYGMGRWSDGTYGGPDQADWLRDQVAFTPRVTSINPWDRSPAPFSGCPLMDGWRIVVDWLGNWDPAARLYGTLRYGDGAYGDVSSSGLDQWNDITEHVSATGVLRGCVSGEQVTVPVASARFTVLDDDGNVIGVPSTAIMPKVGTRWRVGVLDPQQRYWWLYVGRVETVADEHDAPPRLVDVQTFGHIMDLVHRLEADRPAETADRRVRDLLDLSGWDWATFTLWPGAPAPAGDLTPAPVVAGTTARQLLDVAAASAGWSLDTDERGRLRAMTWPLPVNPQPVVEVTDCAGTPAGALVAQSIMFAADMAELVNTVTLTTTSDTDPTVTAIDDLSVQLHGVRDSAFGLPGPPLNVALAAAGSYAQRIVDRYGMTVERVATVTVDCASDPAWLPVLAALDRGALVRVHRTELAPVTLDAVVAGIEHSLLPGAWTARIHLTTT